MNLIPANTETVQAIQGDLLGDAVLTTQDMVYMNFARLEFNRLFAILWPMVEPSLARGDNPVASDIARHLEQVRTFSGNFCWRHRHLGESHGVVGQGDMA